MLIGYTNKLVTDIGVELLENEIISKLLYYVNSPDEDILELPPVENPTRVLKEKISLNRRLETLQRDSDVGMYVSLYSKIRNRERGVETDYTLNNIIEVGILCHNNCDETLNGSRTYALVDLAIAVLSGYNIDGLGRMTFTQLYKTKDIGAEHTGYQLYFEIHSLREEL